MELTTFLRVKLREKRLSDYELAKQCGITKSGMSKILNGKTKNPSLASIQAIADVLGISTQTILDHLPSSKKYSTASASALKHTETNMVPVISMVLANEIIPLSKEQKQKKALDFIPTSLDTDSTFGVRVDQDQAPFSANQILIIEPEPPENGQYVLLQTPDLESKIGRFCQVGSLCFVISLDAHRQHWIVPLENAQDSRVIGIIQETYWKPNGPH
jgi:transcriptional regulator with XRE-family HTH domain